jgi:hypothetical protein
MKHATAPFRRAGALIELELLLFLGAYRSTGEYQKSKNLAAAQPEVR